MRLSVAFVMVAATGVASRAERLDLRFLGPAEGLPHTRVTAVAEDERGFLWFATPEGLARYDGAVVRTYGKRDGLPVAGVRDLLITRSGDYLLGTQGAGVWRLDESGALESRSPTDAGRGASVLELHEDPTGRVWAGTETGALLLDLPAGATTFREVDLPPETEGATVMSFADDPDGSLWIGTSVGLLRRSSEGRLLRYRIPALGRPTRFRALRFDDGERLWIGHEYGLIVYARRPFGQDEGTRESERLIPLRSVDLRTLDQVVPLPDLAGEALALACGDDLTRNAVRSIDASADGRIWISQVGRGLLGFDGTRFSRYDKRHGLRDDSLNEVHEDRAGGLWLASDAGGAMRVNWDGLTGFGSAEGLGHTFITGLYDDRRGALVAVAGNFQVSSFDGRAFDSVSRALPDGVDDPYFWQDGTLTREGEWWLPTDDGLYRFAPSRTPQEIGTARPVAVYRRGQGLPGPTVGAIFEDRSGDLWLSVLEGDAPLARWERATERFHVYGSDAGLPASAAITTFAAAPDGRLWLGFDDGGIARSAGAGAFERLPVGSGAPQASVGALLFDAAGRLWIATRGAGLGRVDDPGSGRLEGRTLTRADGLASESVYCLVDDRFGRIYAGTGRGIHRVSGDGERVVRLVAGEGLPNDEVQVAHRDPRGDLWFGTLDGLARLRPKAQDDVAPIPPAVFVSSLLVNGSPWPVPDRGAEELGTIVLPPGRSQLHVDYFALAFVPGDAVRYEYRLGGADDTWTDAGAQRSVTYANLAAGRYDFRLRAADSTGLLSPRTAGFHLIVRPPFWRTPAFAAIVLALCATAGWVLHRNRVARLLAVERLRTRIATDLHDDVGSNLSHVAILSEVTLRRLDPESSRARESLARIAEVSRETIDTMGDIVWAINPERDRLGDLVLRMRRLANDMFVARGVDVRFSAPDHGLDRRLDANTKRQLYRVLKESLNNAARHSGCAHVRIEVEPWDGGLRLAVRDDGRGFDTAEARAGHGLESMRARAENLGGRLIVRSEPGAGTEVVLEVPHVRSAT